MRIIYTGDRGEVTSFYSEDVRSTKADSVAFSLEGPGGHTYRQFCTNRAESLAAMNDYYAALESKCATYSIKQGKSSRFL